MKVFLSSTYLDLIEHRKAVIQALRTMGEDVDHMEIFGARNEEPKKASLKELDECQILVGIYAYRYGTVPKGSKTSVTEQEYLHAASKKIPILVFVVNEDHDWPPKKIDESLAKVKKFKAKASSEHTPAYFTTPDNLAAQVVAAVGKHAKRLKAKKRKKPSAKSPSSREALPKEIVKGVRDDMRGSTLPNQPYFFGREKELKQISEALSPDSRTWGALIDGPGGIGKTALAIKAAHDAPAELFERKIFITAKIRELTPEGEKPLVDFSRGNYFSMLNELALELGEEGIPRLAPDERANPLRMAMAGKKTLIVFDNLETLSEDERTRLFQFLSRLPEGNKAIVTSRRRADVDARVIRLDRLSADEALQLIEELAKNNPRLTRENEKARRSLYEITNGNPLLIKWACGQLGREGSAMHTIAEACKFIENAPKDNDPLEYIFGDLLATFTESETKVLAALTHFTQPAKLKWIVNVTGLAEQIVETTLDDLNNRSILISQDETQKFFLPTLAAKFISKKQSEAVNETGNRLADYAIMVSNEYGKSNSLESFDSLNGEWLLISASLPRFFRGENDRLQSLYNALDRFLDFSGLWDERLGLILQAEERARENKDFLISILRVMEASAVYNKREQYDEASKCLARGQKDITKIKNKNATVPTGFFRYIRPPVLNLSGIALHDKEYARLYINQYNLDLDWWQQASLEKPIKVFSGKKKQSINELYAKKPRSIYLSVAKQKTIKALQKAKNLDNKDAIAIFSGNLAKIYTYTKKWIQAEPVAWNAFHLAEEIGNQELIASSSMCLALVLRFHTHNPKESTKFASRAVEIFSRLHHVELFLAQEILGTTEEIKSKFDIEVKDKADNKLQKPKAKTKETKNKKR